MAKEYPEGFGSTCDRLDNPALYLAMGAALLHRDEVRLSGEEGCYGWSNGAGLESVYRLEVEGEVRTVYLRYDAAAGRYQWRTQEGRSGEFGWEPLDDNASACLVEGRRVLLDHVLVGGALDLHTPMGPLVLSDVTRRPAQGSDEVGTGRIVASMDGAIIGVEVKVGQRVEKGDVVAVLEAMKMEHSLKADVDGLIESVTVAAGAQVKGKQLLVVISPESDS
jgi:geranyl-CoA carboxylase alpha subunit